MCVCIHVCVHTWKREKRLRKREKRLQKGKEIACMMSSAPEVFAVYSAFMLNEPWEGGREGGREGRQEKEVHSCLVLTLHAALLK